ncbi:unnamed protein product, partial [Chrysoparadoxa australica]
MTRGRPQLHALDATAVTLSGLCLIHCVALPMVFGVLPLACVIAEAEWLHKAFVIMAVPVTIFVMTRCDLSKQERLIFNAMAGTGLSLLLAAAFVHDLHDYETVLTVCGAVLLAGAQTWRWR